MQIAWFMYSRARIAGHPIHPMLVGFPIALYVATVATMLMYVGTRDAFWYRAALTANIGGVLGGLLAAIPNSSVEESHPLLYSALPLRSGWWSSSSKS